MAAESSPGRRTAYAVLVSLTASHLINDMVQSLLPALYPMLKTAYALSFLQIGLLTFTSHATASILQPIVGFYTDRRPHPGSLAAGMGITLAGLLLLAGARSYPMLIGSAALVGVGSSIFHPESSRVARLASGGKHGLAQSLFQTGGNAGSSLGPLLAALIVLPRGQTSVAWFSVAVLAGIVLLWRVGQWYGQADHARPAVARVAMAHPGLSTARVWRSMCVLVALVFSKYIYLVSLTTYFTFYLIHHFGVPVAQAQLHLFAFLVAVTAGTFIGGPVGDRVGRKTVI